MLTSPEDTDAAALFGTLGKDALMIVATALVAYLAGRKEQAAKITKAQAEAAQITATTETATWQVSNVALKDWMDKALLAADRINQLSQQLTESQVKNGALQMEINDLKDFLQQSLDLLHQSGGSKMREFASFEKKIKKVLER